MPVADELEIHLRAELDFEEEAHNTELIARLVVDYDRLFVPEVIQLDPLTRLPRRIGHVLSELEQGALKIGFVPTGLGELEANLRSIVNCIGAAIIVAALLLASAMLVPVHTFRRLGIAGFCLAGGTRAVHRASSRTTPVKGVRLLDKPRLHRLPGFTP